MTMPVKGRALLVAILSASFASTIGGLPFNSLPVLLGSLADSYGFAPRTVGLIGSTCFAGYLAGTLGAPVWMNRLDWRALTLVSAAGTAGAFVLAAAVRQLPVMFAAWALIGFFASTMTCLGMRVLADVPDKVRAFGVRQGTELSVTAAVLFALPPLVIAHWHFAGAALALALVVAVLALSALRLPRGPMVAPNRAPGSLRALPRAASFVLLTFFLFLVGNIGLWAFLERVGASLHIAPASEGLVFAVLKLLGGLAAFSTALAGERFGRRAPLAAATALVMLGLALLASATGFAMFALGAWSWEFAFTCGCVLQTAEIARADATGRAVVLAPAAFALASMLGPGLAGRLLAGGSFAPVFALALASSLVPLGVMALRGVIGRARRRTRGRARPVRAG
ncbi:MFS transporter [Paraburkholderia sacchari]|uniref:MFS transporter n=1 Tax=Paraburkholderia sacchari TaxID=159450 RepID=UPI001BCB2898|nr:MFS transporter [Paraburkholderia sacchari]